MEVSDALFCFTFRLLDQFQAEIDTSLKVRKAQPRSRQFPAGGSEKKRCDLDYSPYLRYRNHLTKNGPDADSMTSRTEASTQVYSSCRDYSNLVSTHPGHGMDSIRCKSSNSPVHQYSPSHRKDRRDDSNAIKDFNEDWLTNDMVQTRWKSHARHLPPTLIQHHRQDASPRQDFNIDWLKQSDDNENRKQPRLRRLVEKLRATEALTGSDDQRYPKHNSNTETEQLKHTLREQQARFDKEKGTLQTEIERLKNSHENQVRKLQSDLEQATAGSHKIYLAKLNEVIDYHEALHVEETAAMNQAIEEVKEDKDKAIAKLQHELQALRSKPSHQTLSKELFDPDLQVCLDYLKDESKARVHRFAQYEGTMRTLQSMVARSRNLGYSSQDRQDMDGLLDMLLHVYRVAEGSHAKTIDVSKLLIREHSEMSKRTNDFENMKERLADLQTEATLEHHPQRRTDVCERCEALAEDMEESLYRGLGLTR